MLERWLTNLFAREARTSVEVPRPRLLPAERKMLNDVLAFSEQLGRDSKTGVMVMLVGSFAKSLKEPGINPKDIDLNIVFSAQPDSEQQRALVIFAEKVMNDFLKKKQVPYVQRAGFDWYLIKGSNGEETVWRGYSPHNLRFSTFKQESCRSFDIMISGFGEFDIKGHLEYEKKHERGPYVILLDTTNPLRQSAIL